MSIEITRFYSVNKELIEAVLKSLPKGSKLLLLVLTGSRAKNLDSPDSDFDFKAIIINNAEAYLFQEVISPLKINPSSFRGLELEGQVLDLYTAGLFALDTNPFIREIMRSPVVFQESSEIIETIRDIYLGAYNSYRAVCYLYSQIKLYIGKGVKDEEGNYNKTAPAKIITEIFHIILALRAFHLDKELEENYVIEDLYQFAGKDEELMRDIVKIRREKKNTPIEITEEIKKIIDEEYKKVYDEIKKRKQRAEPPEIIELREQFKPKVRKIFLKYAFPHVHELTKANIE